MRGQIWTVLLPDGYFRPALVVGFFAGSKSAIVLPIVSKKNSELCLRLTPAEIRQPAYVSCDILSIVHTVAEVPTKTTFRVIGKATKQTLEQTDQLLTQILGLKNNESEIDSSKLRRGQIWHTKDSRTVIKISSDFYDSKFPDKILVVSVTENPHHLHTNSLHLASRESGTSDDVYVVFDTLSMCSKECLDQQLGTVTSNSLEKINAVLLNTLEISGQDS